MTGSIPPTSLEVYGTVDASINVVVIICCGELLFAKTEKKINRLLKNSP